MQHTYKAGFILFLCFYTTLAVAQKKQYTMAEATNGLSTTLAPKSLKQTGWRPGTHEFFYRGDKDVLKVFDADMKDTVMRADVFTRALGGRSGFVWVGK